ncbi:MAG: glycosyltransferase family 4 protein [Bacteroidales bacterium]|nr:glycosyltransferase family 4 protein [Bacteroidales bacterium]
MRIAFDAKRLYNNFTGLGNHSRTTIDILTASFPENEYYLYTPKIKYNGVTEPFLHKDRCKTIGPDCVVRGSLWRTIGTPSSMKKNGIELFHGLSNEIPMGLSNVGIPSVVTIHDVAFRTFPDMYHCLDRFIYDTKWRYACKHANRIIAISESTKKDIIRFYNVPEERIDVIYQPVARQFYTPIEVSDKEIASLPPYILYVGSINSRKNLLGVVKAMELLPKDLQIPLVIIGTGNIYKQQVKRYIARKGMEKLFIWPENVTNEQLQQYYTQATAFIYPSFYEGFGLPVVEAQLCGCPVITSDVSSLPEVGGPHSFKVNPNSAKEISESIAHILTDDNLREKMKADGRNYALQNFDPDILAQKLFGVYKDLLK